MTISCPTVFHGRLRHLLRALCSVPCVLRIRRSGTEPAPATFGTPRETSLSYLCPAKGRFGKLYFLPPNIPTPPERVPRGRAQQSMQKEPKAHGLPYPKRIRHRFIFWVSRPVAAAVQTRPFSLLSTRNDRTASISAAAGFTPRWTYIILYCSGLCGKDAPGGLAAGGGPPAVSIVWGPRRPTGRRVDCIGTPILRSRTIQPSAGPTPGSHPTPALNGGHEGPSTAPNRRHGHDRKPVLVDQRVPGDQNRRPLRRRPQSAPYPRS